jgi:hypothetical protein
MRAQFFEVSDQSTIFGGFAERQLWCAVIDRALQDALDRVAAVSESSERNRIRDDARAWFVRNSSEFRIACESAGFDPDELRTRIISMIGNPQPAG